MAKVVFDGDAKTITTLSGITDIDVRRDLYSRWVDWRDSSNNDKFLDAMEYSGLDPIPGGQTGDIYFLKNGWKFLVDLTVTKVSGVLFSRDFDTAYYTLTGIPQYPVEVSSIVNNSNGGVDPNLIATAVEAALQSYFNAIQTKTDQLTFTKAKELDVNVLSQNSAKLYGSGVDSDKWRGTP